MLSKIISEKNIEILRQLLNGAENIAIVTHISPDGDAVGSSLGLAHFLKGLGKQATVIVPNRFPAFFNWLSGAQDIIINRMRQLKKPFRRRNSFSVWILTR
jgi:phosphoesterase RecJ-like protein